MTLLTSQKGRLALMNFRYGICNGKQSVYLVIIKIKVKVSRNEINTFTPGHKQDFVFEDRCG